MSILVLGIGNLSMKDDGIGGRGVQQLVKRHCIPEGCHGLTIDIMAQFIQNNRNGLNGQSGEIWKGA